MFLTCSPYYDTGHGIDAVWENFDGYNITVAVVDIGVSVKHDELSAKIRIAHNFETNDENVEPEDYGIQYSQLTNHGNSAASVIGAVKDNKLCSAGVAYNANIAAAVKNPVINAVRITSYGTGVEIRNDDIYDQHKHVKPAVIIIVAILAIVALVAIVLLVRHKAANAQ
ncbi:FURI1-like protein [Mya arenaria]|uniref:FURI1-like protein n=1 Tax=Mya arenaria TaxID=6604 RepID=A0ABY7ETD6_MYAAR|nr:FURI1-like protein [Mya arenaria]